MSATADEKECHIFTVTEVEAGTRLDKYLTEALSSKMEAALSRARIKQLIEEGHARRREGGKETLLTDASARMKAGEEISLTMPPPLPARPEAQSIPLDILYEDTELIVVVKPAGLVVHPAPGSPDMTLVNALIAHCGDTLSGIGGERRPGIVHRLDKETSGVMVVAKTDRAHRGLADQFAAHGRDGKLTRAYIALVWGEPSPKRGVIDANIARATHNRVKMAAVKPRRYVGDDDRSREVGRRAITHYEMKASYGEGLVSQVECRLETGRTHQIRVHMTHIGHPLLGDPTYGTGMKTMSAKLPDDARAALARLNRQALHAFHLGFEHPVTEEPMSFEAPLPADMAELINTLKHTTNRA